MRPENRDGEGECYQVNAGVRAVYDDAGHRLVSLEVGGEAVDDTKEYTICLQSFHQRNSAAYLSVTPDEMLEAGRHRVVSTSARDVLLEYLRANQNISKKVEGRLVYQ